MNKLTPFEEGMLARESGLFANANPYDSYLDTENWFDWEQGYHSTSYVKAKPSAKEPQLCPEVWQKEAVDPSKAWKAVLDMCR